MSWFGLAKERLFRVRVFDEIDDKAEFELGVRIAILAGRNFRCCFENGGTSGDDNVGH